MNVIIVDDEEVVRDVLSTILKNSGHKVRTAGTGPEGLELLAASPAEFLITDYLMPEMSGAQVVREAKRINPDVKVIVMSGHVDFDGSMAKAADGAHAVLSKPFDSRLLLDILSSPSA